jgi:hypothetical protein
MDKVNQLFDQIKDTFSARFEQFQETDTYIQIKEKYDNLSPIAQKSILFGSIILVVLTIFLVPFGWFSTSQDYVRSFEENKNLIVSLLEVTQEAKKIPPQVQRMTSSEIKSQMQKILSDKGIPKEQISNFSEVKLTNPPGSTLIPPGIDQNAVELSLKKLTLRQVIDIGYEFDRISPLTKTLVLEMKANSEDNHYYDTLFKVSSFSVQEAATPQQPTRQRR